MRHPSLHKTTLTPKQKAFCRVYVECGVGARAAREAGYTHAWPNQTATGLLKLPWIRKEIERLRRMARVAADRLVIERIEESERPEPIDPELAKMLVSRRDADADAEAALTRGYVLTACIEGLEMSLGRRPMKKARVVRDEDGADGARVWKSVTFEQLDTDLPSARGFAAELLKALLPMDGAEGQQIEGISIERKRYLDDLISAFSTGAPTPAIPNE